MRKPSLTISQFGMLFELFLPDWNISKTKLSLISQYQLSSACSVHKVWYSGSLERERKK